MHIIFKKVILHNFLSYGDAEIDLIDKGYCLVKGINKCPLDNALSNGSGKSSWVSAICWCLTGETLQGLISGIKNIYTEENSCFVTLLFEVDSDSYEVTRIKEPSPNLKIVKNGEDISGKGIRESSIILAQYIPDLNRQLLCSVILLGQGLPTRFTNNTPSGRKEVLEELSKSDFMIEDLKNRLTERGNVLKDTLKTLEETLLLSENSLTIYNNQLSQIQIDLSNLNVDRNYEVELKEVEDKCLSIESEIKSLVESINTQTKIIDENTVKLSDVRDWYNKESNVIADDLRKAKTSFDILAANKMNDIKNLSHEIEKLDSIQDVCPTCGRPFEGVKKPDTSSMKETLSKLKEEYAKFIFDGTEFNTRQDVLNEECMNKRTVIEKNITDAKNSKSTSENLKYSLEQELKKQTELRARIISDKDNNIKRLKELSERLKTTEKTIAELNKDIETSAASKELTEKHIDVIRQMDTFVKRDFRGMLLSDVIEYINIKAKEYCNDVFGTEELNFILDGNNIDISYCGKSFESLSGGEQQKVNIIIQFALRDMLETYLDFHSNILVLDEVYDNLDINGVTNINNLISEKLNDIESVFIISHHADELQLPTDSELTIVKNVEGISSIL